MEIERFRGVALLVARLLLAAVFLYDAVLIVEGPGGTAGYLEQFGVPGALVYPALALEAVGGVLLVIGLMTRLAALGLGLFCIATALIFHHNLGDASEVIQLGKDLGLAGGFLLLVMDGAGALSVDHFAPWRMARRATP